MAESNVSNHEEDPDFVGYDSPDDEWLSQNKCTDPDMLNYRRETEAYEFFYVTENENVRKNYLGVVQPCYSDQFHVVVSAAKLGIERHNQLTGESLEFEELIRSNFGYTSGALHFITFRASNGKFYETKLSIHCSGKSCTLFFLRPAKYYPNLDSASSSSSSSEGHK